MQNETIVDRVVARLKAQPLGDLITEEDLHDIVKQAIPKTFFDPRRISDRHGTVSSYDPLIVEIMRDLMKDAAKTAVEQWVAANADVIAEYWRKVIDVGLLEYVRKIENEIATAQVKTVLRPLLESFNQQRMRDGQSPVYL